jgi:hypothetical protein
MVVPYKIKTEHIKQSISLLGRISLIELRGGPEKGCLVFERKKLLICTFFNYSKISTGTLTEINLNLERFLTTRKSVPVH